jgi:hypothetical protein
MFQSLTRKSQLQQTAARVALFAFLAALLVLPGLVYPGLSGDRTFPSAQEEVVAPAEAQFPSLIPSSPDSAGETMERLPVLPIRHFPAIEGDQAIPSSSETVRLAGISTHRIPTVHQLAYIDARFPSLLTGT